MKCQQGSHALRSTLLKSDSFKSPRYKYRSNIWPFSQSEKPPGGCKEPAYNNLIINPASVSVSAVVVLRSKALRLVKLSDGPVIPLGAKCLIGGFGKRRAEKPKGLTAAVEPGTTSPQPPYRVLCHCVRHVAVKIAGRPNYALLFQRSSQQEMVKAWNICVVFASRETVCTKT